MSSVDVILACSLNGVIGYRNSLPWGKVKGDLPRFKKLTTGRTIVMGRNTWESIGKPLPDRKNIVLSTKYGLVNEHYFNVKFVSGLDRIAYNESPVIIGGSTLYNYFIWEQYDRFIKSGYDHWLAPTEVKNIYFTLVNQTVLGDTFFDYQKLFGDSRYNVIDKEYCDENQSVFFHLKNKRL